MVGREGVAPPQRMAAALQAVGLAGAQPTEKDERVVRDGARQLVLDGPMRLSKSARGTAGARSSGLDGDPQCCCAGPAGIEPTRRRFWRPPGYLSLVPW